MANKSKKRLIHFLILWVTPTSGHFLLLPVARSAQEATDYAAHFNKGQSLMQDMQCHEATDEFRAAVRSNPEYIAAQQALTLAYVCDNNLPMAWKQVIWLRRRKIDFPDGLIRALSSSLSESDALKQLAEDDKNLETAQQAALARPEDPAVLAALGLALGANGDYASAEQTAERALALNPEEPGAHLLLAKMFASEHPNSERAVPHLKAYLRNVPRTADTKKDVAEAYWILGSVYGRSGREKKALETYEQGLTEAPEHSRLLNNAAWIYATANDPSLHDPGKALIYARKAVVLSNGKKATFLDTLAESLYANGQFDEAAASERKALALEPGNDLYADQLKKFQAALKKVKHPSL